jgi:hypothetical protein
MVNKSRENELEKELFNLSEKWRRDLGADSWLARRFRRMINAEDSDYRGGVWTVRHLLYTRESSGFRKLHKHPHLTVESFILGGQWDDIFDKYDKEAAKRKLAAI